MERIIVVGAGIGGLVTGAALAKRGHEVTVLEAHIYPGGCAGTFFHQGYRFNAGATLLAGFYRDGPMDLVARAAGISQWPVRPVTRVMTVHLPDGNSIDRMADNARWDIRRLAFGSDSLSFWEWQEAAADAVWDLGLSLPPWPPSDLDSLLGLPGPTLRWLARRSARQIVRLAPDILRPVHAHLSQASSRLRAFVDAQLLISAQTTSRHANSLYAAAALDMPRRGAVQVEGGVGSIATTLASAVEAHGGRVVYRQRVRRIEKTRDGFLVHTRGQHFAADQVILNLTPPDILPILDPDIRTTLKPRPKPPVDAWGAFMLYLGVDRTAIPELQSNHHQIVGSGSLSEAGSVFVSFSPEWDASRASTGKRAVTLSTHTRLDSWWRLHHENPEAFETRKTRYMERVLNLVERVFPSLPDNADLLLPATPLTFARFTGRSTGWVGGIPQTHLWRTRSPRLGRRLWMVGDSIFPGQSVAAVALGGLRVARDVLGPDPLSRITRRNLKAVKPPI